MSLLLDALKKAEKAKEEAQRRALQEGAGAAATPAEPRTDQPPAAEATEAKRVRTRDQLPQISQSLEIRDEDLAADEQAQRAAPALELEKEEPPLPRPAQQPPQRSAAAFAGAQAADRATAKRVFEAKFKEPNPRMPFYLALAALGALAVGTVIYFWYQLRPPAPLVNATPRRPASEQVASIAPPAAPPNAPAAAPAQVPGLPPPPATPVPGLPAEAAAPAVAVPAGGAPGMAAPVAPAAGLAEKPAPEKAPTPAARAAAQAERPAPPATEPIRGRSRRIEPTINPQVSAGYRAYEAGDFTAARTDYEQALRAEPMNRDALLGLAAVEMKAQRYDLAETYYERVLQANPRDPNAQAGLLALRSQMIDPVVAESRVKTLLASDPQADVLYFTLGNEYALQERWGEARQAYLRALAADPENPDFAYNLAVSLDHLGERGLALEYYGRALALAGKRAASFDALAARERVQQLSR